MASDNMKHRRLQELGESDFEIVEGQPDIRGWDVKTSDGQKIGEVEELILDAQQRKVRYMVVDLDDNELDIDDDKEVLIPIGLAELHKDDDDVIVPRITAAQLRSLPEYDDDELTPEIESNISTVLGRTGTTGVVSGDYDAKFYDHDYFNDQNLYRSRFPETGSLSDTERSMRFRSRMDSGSEEEGYTGSETPGYGRDRSGVYDETRIEDESTVPVNRSSLDDADELRLDRDEKNLRDERSLRDEKIRKNREDEIRGSGL